MEVDADRIDEAALALLCLGLHDGQRDRKSLDWNAMQRLHKKGLIFDPVGRAKSFAFTDEGLAKAQSLLRELFAKTPAAS